MQHFRRPKAETLVMLLVVSGFAFFALGQSCDGGGGTPQWSISSVALSGPATLENDGPNAVYTATITVTRTGGSGLINTGPSPWWLVDEDSPLGGNDLLSFTTGVTVPAGSTTTTASWSLGCVNRTVRGTALTGPDGSSPNNNDSGEGNAYMFGPDSGPADMRVSFQGNFVSNTLSVTCMCGGSVCP